MKNMMFFILTSQVILNLITKGFKTFQNICVEKIDAIIKSNINPKYPYSQIVVAKNHRRFSFLQHYIFANSRF